jgi:HemY protein
MRSLFWLLTLAALAIGVALLGRLSDGYVLWVVPPWRVELSLNLFVLAQLAALVLVYLLLRAIVNTLKMPRIVAEYRARRARQRDERAAAEALRLFWEGRYGHALKSAEQVGRHEAAPKVGAGGTAAGLAALVALKAAHALHDETRIAEWQAHAHAHEADTGTNGWRTALLMTEIGLALDARDFGAAEAALEKLGAKERRQISVQRLALRLAQGRGDWAEMLRITRLLEKHRALTLEQALPLRLRAHRGMLDGMQDDPAQIVRYWQGVPAPERLDLPLVQRATRALTAAGACAENALIIEDVLDERWEPELLEDYARCAGGDVLGRIAHCEKWLHAHPHDAMLLLALGRLCAQRQLWGKARSYLEASLAVAASCAAHVELARLLDHLERPDDANRHYRAAAACLDRSGQSQSRGGRKSV